MKGSKLHVHRFWGQKAGLKKGRQCSRKRQYCRLGQQLFPAEDKNSLHRIPPDDNFFSGTRPQSAGQLILLSGDSLRLVNRAKISIHAQSLKSGTIEQVGVAFL